MALPAARRHQLQKKPCTPASRIGLTSRGGGRWWKRYQGSIDPTRLVFIDETWAKTNMTRTHGWHRRGERLLAKVPHGHWRTMTFLAALRHDRITAPCVIDGPINGESFRAYVEQFLVPTLQPATSSSWTISARTKAASSAAPSAPPARASSSCRPTRPDLNPIEQVFAKLKTLLRKAAERTIEASGRASGICSRPSTSRMRQLSAQRRICFDLMRKGSSICPLAGLLTTGAPIAVASKSPCPV